MKGYVKFEGGTGPLPMMPPDGKTKSMKYNSIRTRKEIQQLLLKAYSEIYSEGFHEGLATYESTINPDRIVVVRCRECRYWDNDGVANGGRCLYKDEREYAGRRYTRADHYCGYAMINAGGAHEEG